jgi:hypothetical protein
MTVAAPLNAFATAALSTADKLAGTTPVAVAVGTPNSGNFGRVLTQNNFYR